MRSFLVLFAAAFAHLLAPAASAQERALLSGVDFTFGVGRGLGGPRANERNLPSFGITAAVPVLKRDRGMIVAALHGSRNGWWEGYGCTLLTPPDRCYGYPNDESLSLLGGWGTHRGGGNVLRVMLGPAVARTSEDRRGAAMVARFDMSAIFTSRTSILLWTQYNTIPSRNGAFLSVLSAGIGIRAHGDASPLKR